MKKRTRIWALMLVIVIGVAIGVEKHFDRTIVYECTNTLTNVPTFIKIRTYGAIKLLTEGGSSVVADIHHSDGDVTVIVGEDLNYFDDDVVAQWEHHRFDATTNEIIIAHAIISFDLLTGGYTIGVIANENKPVLATGFCVKKIN